MSTFLRILRGAAKSNTVQANGTLLALFAIFRESAFVQANPDLVAIFAAITAVSNILLRFKTKKPLAER